MTSMLLDEPTPLDTDRVAHAKWSYRALSDDELRELGARRIELSPEESAALTEVLSERHVSLHPPRVYRGGTGFVQRHWNGDYPLARSYWLHSFLLTSFVSGLLLSTLQVAGEFGKARHISLAVLAFVFASLALAVWSNVGTWASATKHANRGGSAFWAGVAQVLVALGLLGQVLQLVKAAPALGEHVRVALGEQPGDPVQFVLRVDGKSLLLRGGINDDTAEALEQALQRAPQARVVVLESGGGWIRQGEKIAEVIARRGLDTYVESECSSSCTIAFLAGRDRAADPHARLGFHAFRGVGGRRSTEDEQRVYGAAGLSTRFIERVRNTPPEGIWYPDHAALLHERVLTRASAGGETAAISTDLKTRSELAAEFRKSRLHALLAKKYPQHFDAIVDAAWKVVRERGTDRQVLAAAARELAATSRALLPVASNETMEEYAVLLQDQAAALLDTSPEACSQLLFRRGWRTDEYRRLLPKSLVSREQDLLYEIVATGAPEPGPRASDAQVAMMLRQVTQRMKPRDAAVIATLDTQPHTPQESCSAGLSLLEALLALPWPQRAQYARALFAS
jgi:hypothetical protein